MPGNKKAKKKYTPKPVYFPNIVNSMFAFDPLVEALDRLIEYGEIQQDDFDNYVYTNPANEEESFVAGLEIYYDVTKLVAERLNKEIDVSPLAQLREEMEAKEGFDEDTILNAAECLKLCKVILANAPTLTVREITLQIADKRRSEK